LGGYDYGSYYTQINVLKRRNISNQYKWTQKLDLCRVPVLLSSIETINDVFSKDECLGRPMHGAIIERNGDPFGMGMLFSEGDFWRKKRAWTIKVLKEQGFGQSSSMESSTKAEIESLLERWDTQLESNNSVILEGRNVFANQLTKIIWKMIVGRLYPVDLAIMKEMMKKSELMIKAGTFGPGLMMIAPFLKHVAPTRTGHAVFADFMEYAKQVASVSTPSST
jgi:hypothetical protein